VIGEIKRGKGKERRGSKKKRGGKGRWARANCVHNATVPEGGSDKKKSGERNDSKGVGQASALVKTQGGGKSLVKQNAMGKAESGKTCRKLKKNEIKPPGKAP